MPLPSDSDAKLWLALLHEIEQSGGKAAPKDVIPKLTAHFPEITPDDLALTTGKGEPLWTNRIRWARQRLVERGCLLKITGIWEISDEGRRWVDTHWTGPEADYARVPKPPRTKKPADPGVEKPSDGSTLPTGGTAGDGTVGPPVTPQPPLVVISDPTDKLCTLLQATQRESNAPQKFEAALADAFAALGFEARHIGGSGETDIFITASLGASSYSAVLDAKSTQSGKVPDAQINWPVIDSHRQARRADYAAVIGEDFSGGQLQKFADQYNVTLLTTGMFCDILRLHASTPLTLNELRDLFLTRGRADQAVLALRQRNAQHLRHWRLIAEIVVTMEIFEARFPDGFSPQIDQLHLVLTTQSVSREHGAKKVTDMPTRQDVADAVGYLASRAVQVLTEVPGSNGAYQLAMSAATSRKRVLALARSLEDAELRTSAPQVVSAHSRPSPAG